MQGNTKGDKIMLLSEKIIEAIEKYSEPWRELVKKHCGDIEYKESEKWRSVKKLGDIGLEARFRDSVYEEWDYGVLEAIAENYYISKEDDDIGTGAAWEYCEVLDET